MMRRATDTEETSEHVSPVSPVSPSNTTSTGPSRRYWPTVHDHGNSVRSGPHLISVIKKDTNGERPAVGGLRPWAEPGIG
jgi:hypothetical protein